MQSSSNLNQDIFNINSDKEFEKMAIRVCNFQYDNNTLYKDYCDLLKTDISAIKQIQDIPFLPISFFKTAKVQTTKFKEEDIFYSSGTTGGQASCHYIKSLSVYEASFLKAFEYFYGHPSDYLFLGLLPNYLERKGSSLVYMVNHLMKVSGQVEKGFYLNELKDLVDFIKGYKGRKKIFLFGVSYALLDLAEMDDIDLSNLIVMETGGMKGRRKEMIKKDLHDSLKNGLGCSNIHSEYGMTELLSQAYAKKAGIFETPPWMKILIREFNDPFTYSNKKTGGINVIDLANLYSCSFIATQDLGRYNEHGFEVVGRFDNSDIRGCNLMIQ